MTHDDVRLDMTELELWRQIVTKIRREEVLTYKGRGHHPMSPAASDKVLHMHKDEAYVATLQHWARHGAMWQYHGVEVEYNAEA